jgi:hypothetical protein
MANGQQAGSIIFGGFFVGLWLYLCLFRTDLTRGLDVGYWVLFGVIGLALAGGIYGTRLAGPMARTILYVVLGVAIAFLTAAFLLQQLGEGVAALITFVGAALIVTALPVPNRPAPAA